MNHPIVVTPFEGIPVVSNLLQIRIGSEVPKMHEYDHGAEELAIRGYNAIIRMAVEAGDNNTKVILESLAHRFALSRSAHAWSWSTVARP